MEPEIKFATPILDLFLIRTRIYNIINNIEETKEFTLTDLKYLRLLSDDFVSIIDNMEKQEKIHSR